MSLVDNLRVSFDIGSVCHPELFAHLASMPERFRAERVRYLCDLGRVTENLLVSNSGPLAGWGPRTHNDERMHINLIVHRPIYPELVEYLSEIGRGRSEAIRSLACKGLLILSGAVPVGQKSTSTRLKNSEVKKEAVVQPANANAMIWDPRGGSDVRRSILRAFGD